jgi:hypothetical protein
VTCSSPKQMSLCHQAVRISWFVEMERCSVFFFFFVPCYYKVCAEDLFVLHASFDCNSETS